MRHRNTVNKLNRAKTERVSLIRNLLKSIVIHETINTTENRYKAIRSHFDKLINQAKIEDNSSFRRLFAILRDEKLCQKAMDIAKTFEGRTGGYLRVYKLDNRGGDNAKMVKVELVK